jgi:hypothetical protein
MRAHYPEWDISIYLPHIFEQIVNHNSIEVDIKDLGIKFKNQLGFNWPWLYATQSKFTLDLYNETIMMTRTYFNTK